MRTFHEFVNDRDLSDVKLLVMNALDPKKTLEWDNASILSMKLRDFENRKKVLTSPEISDIINKRSNRAAIIQALKNDSTTVGNLLAMMTREDSDPQFIG